MPTTLRAVPPGATTFPGAGAGYLAGAFDLFHVGHLDTVSRARARCDRLVVGVLSDQAVAEHAGRAPYVADVERLEIVQHLDAVDAAVLVDDPEEIPAAALDVVFSGDAQLGFLAARRAAALGGLRHVRLQAARQTASVLLGEALGQPRPAADPPRSVDGRLPGARERGAGRRVGYVPGVFDTFHVGHLNILKRARQHCDVLIAGVVGDDVVQRVKGRPAVVPHAERMDIVRALDLVDVAVTDWSSDKYRMWQQLRFDVIFKGDDWKGLPKGDALERDLGAVGVDVVFFPYTKHTSSTMIRRLLSETA